jgi:sulfatase modifying factor 1
LEEAQANYRYAYRGRLGYEVEPIAGKTTKLVGSYPSNTFGLYEMHGNVREWCQDYYAADYYRTSPTVDPQGPSSGSRRVIRGGGFRDRSVLCRSAYRTSLPPERTGEGMTGFRVVLDGDTSQY